MLFDHRANKVELRRANGIQGEILGLTFEKSREQRKLSCYLLWCLLTLASLLKQLDVNILSDYKYHIVFQLLLLLFSGPIQWNRK